MWVGDTVLYKTLKAQKEFSPAQAYLIAEIAYTTNAELLWSDTYSTRPTFRNLQKRGLIEAHFKNLVVKLTEQGKAVVNEICRPPSYFVWQTGDLAPKTEEVEKP